MCGVFVCVSWKKGGVGTTLNNRILATCAHYVVVWLPQFLTVRSDGLLFRSQNMVGPGEVDDDLQPEVVEECAKYGEVVKVIIYEVRVHNLR